MSERDKFVLRKTTFEQEQAEKDAYFAGLSPAQRFEIHEQLRQKIWGRKYNSLCLEGLKVIKKPAP